ncbi:Thioredoxin-like [Spirosomataceae bacterium TFI 002]|nr:Thioredoxin-like [Spirosomataceae bacterium TFI 002]
MRIAFILSIFLFFGCKSNSQETSDVATSTGTGVTQGPINENEITWEADFNAALAKAKANNQLLFVECYSPTCPVCQTLEPFFKESEVAKKYNRNFVNFKLDVGKQEVVKHLNDRNIWLPSFPMFLFFDGDGNLVHQSDVTPDVASLTGVADKALDPSKRANSYAKRFKDGDRSMDLLASYAAFSRVIRDTAGAVEAGEELFKVYPKDELGSETSWKLTKKCIVDVNNGFAKYWFNNYAKAKEIETKDGHAGNENNIFGGIIQNSLLGNRGKDYNTSQLNDIRKYMGLVGAGQYADTYMWELETKANIREGNTAKALAIGNSIIGKYQGNGSAAVYITRVFIDNFPNNNFVGDARKWLASALPSIQQENQKAEYYYESSRLYQKSGDLVNAKKDAKTAMDLATKSGVSDPKFAALVSSLK